MLKRIYRKMLGFTFTELMIALALNALLFTVIITVFLNNLDHYKRMIKINRLDQELQVAMDVMSRDIRRAGFWGNARSDINSPTNNNPFVVTGTTDITTGLSGACILFTYDANADGTLAAISTLIDDEHYGYRLNGTTLQARPPGAAYDCAAASNAWENMTDTNLIQITALNFVINSITTTVGPGTKGIMMRTVDISITGRLASDNSITRTLTNTIKVRNDKFIP